MDASRLNEGQETRRGATCVYHRTASRSCGAATSVAPMLSVRFPERPADPTATELVARGLTAEPQRRHRERRATPQAIGQNLRANLLDQFKLADEIP
jgi:hypothetical protein